MATWYVDPENGTDSAASVGTGDSFATRRKTFTNLVAGVLAPGDEVRVIGSPAPTSIGTATWTDCALKTHQTMAIVSSTNTTPIVVTISSGNYTTLSPAVGDTVAIYNHSTNTNANGVWKISAINGTDSITLVNADGSASVGNGVGGATGTVKWFTNSIVTLSTACTKNVALCGNRGTKTNWTASANVTSSIITNDQKEGAECLSLAVAAGFTTGLAAYYATGTLDLSGYQQLSFWIKQTSGTLGAAGSVRLRLCTDTAGATPVHDVGIPYIGKSSNWQPVVVDLATNLNSAIKSISFDVVTDNGAQTFQIDNIIACKASSSADSLNLTSLISKDPGDHSYEDGYESYWAIQSINGTRIVLEQINESYPLLTSAQSLNCGYSGTSATVTTYKRETLKVTPPAADSTQVNASTVSGTSGSPILYSGGWDRTAMSTQNLETWISGQNGAGYFIYVNHEYLSFDKLNPGRFSSGISGAPSFAVCSYLYIVSMYAWSMRTNVLNSLYGIGGAIDFISAVCTGNAPFGFNYAAKIGTVCSHSSGGVGASFIKCTIDKVYSRNHFTTGLSVTDCIVNYALLEYVNRFQEWLGSQSAISATAGSVIKQLDTAYCSTVFNISGNSKILSGSSTGTMLGLIRLPQNTGYIKDFVINETISDVYIGTVSTALHGYQELVYFENYDGVAGVMHAVSTDGEINSDTGITHGDSTFSWCFSPLSSTYITETNPLRMPIWKRACAASEAITFKAWFRRDNTGITGKLLVRGIYPGITTDVSDSISVAANTWEQLSVTVTPTEDCVIEVFAAFYGGVSYNGYVADLSEA